MEAKLVKHGLPTWGTDEQVKDRLTVNGIISPCTTPVLEKDIEHKKIGKVLCTYVDSDFSTNGQPHHVVVSDTPAPRKMGRPKKVK